jgi:N-acylneuraminate cytidylyltransferase
MSKVAIIPARGGSKRIPRKNIREFCGKPMIAWSIEKARESGCFERIIVSTDDAEIREISLAYGAEVPFARPKNLANDEASTLPVVRHAVEWLNANGSPVTYACCIYATAPLLQSSYVKKAIDQLSTDPQADFVFSVTPFDYPIFRALQVSEGGRASMFWPEHETTRSQDLPDAHHDAGQFYWGTAAAWLEKDLIFSSNSHVIILPKHLVQDIDTLEDWHQAVQKFKFLNNDLSI